MNLKHAVKRSIANPSAAAKIARALARGRYYQLKYRLRGQRLEVGRFFRVYGRLEIRGPGRVIFGDHCNVISSRLAPTTIFTHHPDAVIRFGNQVQLTGTRFGCERLIEVGDLSGLSDARLMDTDFHALEVYDQPRYNTSGVSKPIIIGRNAWIGAGAMVLKGVKIGENSVVAAGAVVAQNVPPNAVVFGNPARVVWRLRGPAASRPVPAADTLSQGAASGPTAPPIPAPSRDETSAGARPEPAGSPPVRS